MGARSGDLEAHADAEDSDHTEAGELANRIALVTGASSGIGWTFAELLGSLGATVIATGRRMERLEELARVIESAGGVCIPRQLDLRDVDQITPLVSNVHQSVGTISILVNNAAAVDAQRAHRMSKELIDEVITTNLHAPFLLACVVSQRLIEAEMPGDIINMSSSLAFNYDGAGAALYSVTKAGINRMTEALSVEWAKHRINVNAIAPGACQSEMMQEMIDRVGDLSQGYPRKRLMTPKDLESTVRFLLDPSSRSVTGTIVRVDDGQGTK